VIDFNSPKKNLLAKKESGHYFNKEKKIENGEL